MEKLPKVEVSAALSKVLALMHKGATLPLKETAMAYVGKAKEHPMMQKVLGKADLLWAVLGVVLIFHGTHFKKLFLCIQLVRVFLFERLKTSITGLYDDVSAAYGKMQDDAGDGEPAAAAGTEEASKHAKKRADKKAAESSKKDTSKEDAAAMKKMLKALDAEKFSAACVVVLASKLACVLVLQGGLVQNIVVSHVLVGMFCEKVCALVEFSEHSDMEAWINLSIRAVLYASFLGWGFVAAPMVLALNVAACGAQLLMAHVPQLQKLAGNAALAVPIGVTAFGTLWQVWTWAAGSGMGWYFQILYFPAVIAESILSVF